MTIYPTPVRVRWRRALVYFVTCWLIALAVVRVVQPEPGRAFHGSWWSATAGVFVVAIVAYWVIWPKGTTSNCRPLHPIWALVFGLLWGASEGALAWAVWLMIDEPLTNAALVYFLSFLTIGGGSALWHAIYWDRKIVPEHNIADWNRRKVILVHVPFLVAAIGHLQIYRQPVVFVAAYVVALVGASVAIRMPPPLQILE